MTNCFAESVVEDAALAWLEGLGYTVLPTATQRADQDGTGGNDAERTAALEVGA